MRRRVGACSSPKTCGCRATSLAAIPAATSSTDQGSLGCSWAIREWNTPAAGRRRAPRASPAGRRSRSPRRPRRPPRSGRRPATRASARRPTGSRPERAAGPSRAISSQQRRAARARDVAAGPSGILDGARYGVAGASPEPTTGDPATMLRVASSQVPYRGATSTSISAESSDSALDLRRLDRRRRRWSPVLPADLRRPAGSCARRRRAPRRDAGLQGRLVERVLAAALSRESARPRPARPRPGSARRRRSSAFSGEQPVLHEPLDVVAAARPAGGSPAGWPSPVGTSDVLRVDRRPAMIAERRRRPPPARHPRAAEARAPLPPQPARASTASSPGAGHGTRAGTHQLASDRFEDDRADHLAGPCYEWCVDHRRLRPAWRASGAAPGPCGSRA